MQKILSVFVLVLAVGCAHTPAPVVATAAPVAPKMAAPEVVAQPVSKESQELEAALRSTVIHFRFNEDQLTSDSQERLQKLANVMRKQKAANVKVAGNCDERGTEEYNLALGQRRADVAKKYMVSLGVDGQRVDTVSYGKEKPASPGHDEEAWAQNRRDEFQPQ